MERSAITTEIPRHPFIAHPILRVPAGVMSVIFHPLFIPTIAAWYLAFLQPGIFTGASVNERLLVLARVAYNTIFFPGLTILLLKGLGFIKSIFLKTQRERIIPYVATNLFYFWMYLVFRNQPAVPSELTAYIFGIFIASSIALLANNYFKISMHALGVGSLSGLVLCIIFMGFAYAIFLPAMIVFLVTGMVGSSRLLVGDHSPFEIYAGVAVGIVSQFVGFAIIA